MLTQSISAAQARRIAIAAQGLGKRPGKPVTRQALLKLATQLGVIQLDSVNIISRTHYLPFFSRLGPYDRALLEAMAWGKTPDLTEYWAHEASLILPATRQNLQWRMDDARSGKGLWKNVAAFLTDRRDLLDKVRAQIRANGPLAASQIQLGKKGDGGWWGWSEAKRACECLFWVGDLVSLTRRSNFERVYGLAEDHAPACVTAPNRQDAQRALLQAAATAYGVATERDLRDYFRMNPAETKVGIAALVESGVLEQVTVEGWAEPAYLAAGAKVPARVSGHCLLSPFDNAIWFRERAERMFGTRIRLEIYTPAHKRVHGYYVLPFLQGDQITARVDLKADRKAKVLHVLAAHYEPCVTQDTPIHLAVELRLMAGWLGLERVQVDGRGDLSPALAGAVGRLA
jgi:uncharacterized protein